MPRTETLLEEIRQEFPKFRLVAKSNNAFCELLDWCIRVITMNRQRGFLEDYYTTVGYTVYVPDSWLTDSDENKYLALRHERVHMHQYARLGAFVFGFLYLFPFLPIGLAYGRARLEWEAYSETMRAAAEVHGARILESPKFREYIVSQFTGPAYGWMWPFASRVNRWYDSEAQVP